MIDQVQQRPGMRREKQNTLHAYQRLDFNETPIYVLPDYPDWFVPNQQTDQIIQTFQRHPSTPAAIQAVCRDHPGLTAVRIDHFLARFEHMQAPGYSGRATHLKLSQLKECWFHITNCCNLECTHCMFSSGPTQTEHLSAAQLDAAVEQASALGCEVFYFTGGEPFVFKGFLKAVARILQDPAKHVAILTNGTALDAHREALLSLERARLHFQVSMDGMKTTHEGIRGSGTFAKLIQSLQFLRGHAFQVSLSMSVSQDNVDQMSDLVDLAVTQDILNLHYMWFFKRGQSASTGFVEAPVLAEKLLQAYSRAGQAGVLIDNIESIKSQVFSLPGTRFDLSNAAWQSLAIGPDGRIYPSAALIDDPKAVAGRLEQGLAQVWQESKLLQDLRRASIMRSDSYQENPLRFLTGGGDIDHSFVQGQRFLDHDPYTELYNTLALAVMAEEAQQYDDTARLGIKSRMGERLYDCGENMNEVAFTHSNCVLSLAGNDGHSLARSFYSAAAEEPNEEIFNPVQYDEQEIEHVPQQSRVRNYGCGSPVLDCDLQVGETLIDLGSGTGVECFIAAKKVGPEGRVLGIDMADAMLALARRSKAEVVNNLGYDNIEFQQALFERSPIKSNVADVIISNCVINLSPDKRKTFAEILRMLKPGARLVISDICYDEDIPLTIKYNQHLRGECIGGAFRQDVLFALLEDTGFESMRIIKRFPYREVQGYQFYAITYQALKPNVKTTRQVIYRGPHAAVVTDGGHVLYRGVTTSIDLDDSFDDSVLVLDEQGNAINLSAESCCCAISPLDDQAKTGKVCCE
jgi:7,8-dihydro-6-hydroxymethylpterin dimethyltransferase